MTPLQPRLRSSSFLLLVPLLAAAQSLGYTTTTGANDSNEDLLLASASSSCANWFERDVLCDSINDEIEWSMDLPLKDLTRCPTRCQTCKNYDQFDSNATAIFGQGFFYHDPNGSMYYNTGKGGIDEDGENRHDEHVHELKINYDEDGNFYDKDWNPIQDQDGNWIYDQSLAFPSLPWEMQHFYEYVHCARDFGKVSNIWKTGDSDRMYERIYRDFPRYSPTVLSRPEYSEYALSRTANQERGVGVGPWLIQLEDFLTDEECDEMIAQTKIAIGDTDGGFSTLADEEESDSMGGVCQSTQAWCDPGDCMNQKVLKGAWSKIEELVGLPFDTHTEPVHFIQYVPGQRYGSHTDAISEEYNSVTGPRLFTLLIYLNDIEEEIGGRTCFPQIERAYPNEHTSTNDQQQQQPPICVQPKRGRAVIWPNILNDLPNGTVETADNRTWHEAHGITEGYKYASTVWYHLRNFSYADDIECTDIYTESDFMEFYTESHFMGYGYDDYDDDYDYDDDDDDDDDDVQVISPREIKNIGEKKRSNKNESQVRKRQRLETDVLNPTKSSTTTTDTSNHHHRTHSNFQIASYNVWFGPPDPEAKQVFPKERMAGIVKSLRAASIIKESEEGKTCPLIFVGLQELTPPLVQYLKPHLQNIGYRMCTQPLGGYGASYGIGIAVPEDLVVLDRQFVPYSNSIQGRGFLFVRTPTMLFATTHLESWCGPQFTGSKEREVQVVEVARFCQDQLNSVDGLELAVLAGDLNWDDERKQKKSEPPNRKLLSLLPEGWNDAGTPFDYTYDAKENPMLNGNLRRRLDRCIYTSQPIKTRGSNERRQNFRSTNLQKIGREIIPNLVWNKKNSYNGNIKKMPVSPSDHFGIMISFSNEL